ncbi:hypothetical protein BC827DRAFT_97400 [Russula dissimulans]|nr:hypothetical protein BC827DRAFT_97400 [Russula dissimulans]
MEDLYVSQNGASPGNRRRSSDQLATTRAMPRTRCTWDLPHTLAISDKTVGGPNPRALSVICQTTNDIVRSIVTVSVRVGLRERRFPSPSPPTPPSPLSSPPSTPSTGAASKSRHATCSSRSGVTGDGTVVFAGGGGGGVGSRTPVPCFTDVNLQANRWSVKALALHGPGVRPHSIPTRLTTKLVLLAESERTVAAHGSEKMTGARRLLLPSERVQL